MDNIKRMKRMILLSLLRLLAIVIVVRFAARAQDCAVQVRPPDPAKIPVMHGLVSTDGKSVRMAVADVPPDGVMQRDTRHCEGAAVGGTRAAVGGTRATVQRPGFDIVKLTKLPGSNPAVISAEADYALASLPRTEWASLKDRWPEATR